MRCCNVCASPSKQNCGGCGNVSYCGVNCQKRDWSNHKPTCQPFKVCSESGLGEFLVAARNLKEGDLILNEEVYVLGLPTGEECPAPICLGCYFPAPSYSCAICGAPLCGPSCQTNQTHLQECKILQDTGVGRRLRKEPILYGSITPLRFLLMKNENPARYKKCAALSSNLEARTQQSHFHQYETNASFYVAAYGEDLATEAEFLKILTILDTNSFQVLSGGSAENLAGLYPRVAKLNHSCVPHARTIFTSDYSLKIIASVPIKKGDSITISYTPPFYTTFSRQKILEKGKQFRCRCIRCQDPSDLGTMISAVKCGGCKVGYLLRSGEMYRCTNCGHEMSQEEYYRIDSTLFSVQTNINKENVEDLREILYKYSDILHPNHALLTETRQHLAAALGRVPGYLYDQLDQKQLSVKVEISEHLLEVINVLEPGISKSKGITLLDLTEAKSRLIRMTCKNARDHIKELRKIEQMLEECNGILSYEDEKAIEGNVAKNARTQLCNIRMFLADMRRK